jgi:HPt (histidine-containing phosphotransfer) domain-containing protein
MTNLETDLTKMCDLNYLSEMLGARKPLIKGIIDTFLEQIPVELKSMEEAIEKADYLGIKRYAHSMKSSVSILGIMTLGPVLGELESLGTAGTSLERIRDLNKKLQETCARAVAELESVKQNYV